MPNRILKESICTSEDIARLSQGAEILFYRLIVKADDYGVYLANPAIIRGSCFPLKSDDINLSQVQEWLSELSGAGLIRLYDAEDDRKYLQFTKWERHQQIRAKKPKYPLPDSICDQMIADDSKCPRNPIQYNTIRESSRGSNRKEDKADKPPRARFVPPTVEEVAAYCRERENGIDPQAFVDYYTTANWYRGKTKITDWKACVRTWERKEKDRGQSDTDNIFLRMYEEERAR